MSTLTPERLARLRDAASRAVTSEYLSPANARATLALLDEREALRGALEVAAGSIDDAADEMERLASPVAEWGGVARTPDDERRLLEQRTSLRTLAEECRAALEGGSGG